MLLRIYIIASFIVFQLASALPNEPSDFTQSSSEFYDKYVYPSEQASTLIDQKGRRLFETSITNNVDEIQKMTPTGRYTLKKPEGRMFRSRRSDAYTPHYEREYGHGGGHRRHDSTPYVDRNGCTKPGDIVCDKDAKDLCTYNLCVLADERKSLWSGRPALEVVTTNCPAGRGVSSHFCDENELLRILTRAKVRVGHSDHSHQHVSMYFTPKDPCVVANKVCGMRYTLEEGEGGAGGDGDDGDEGGEGGDGPDIDE